MASIFNWNELLSEIAKKIPPQQFKAWLAQVRFVELTEMFLVIEAPTIFSRDWIADHYSEIIKNSVQELYGITIEPKIQINSDAYSSNSNQNELDNDSNSNYASSSPENLEPQHSNKNEGGTPLEELTNFSKKKKNPHPGSSYVSRNQKKTSFEDSDLNDTLLFDFTHTPGSKKQSLETKVPPISATDHLDLPKNTTLTTERTVRPSSSTTNDHKLDLATEEGSTHGITKISTTEGLAAAISVRDLSTPIIRTLGQPLDPKHTFETFIVGASNQFAHAAARAVAEQPATQYNPLFIYSNAGLGKTHLLHAIGNYFLKVNPKAKICYLSAEKFANDLIESIKTNKMSNFREKYRDSYDVLLMDDIQFIAGKDRTQEEFFHTFNALHSSKRQIVVTSDKFPKDIPGLEDRIRTRFEWGLIADIQPPEIETRIAILRAKAELDDIFLPHDVALFLASNIKSNIRELEGSLIRLGAQASLSGSEISLALAKPLLNNIIKEPITTISPDSIMDAVCQHFGVKISDLKGKERSRRIAFPRQVAMYLIRKYCEKSFPEIGILLGGKDHSTILHGYKAVFENLDKDAVLKQHVEDIQNLL